MDLKIALEGDGKKEVSAALAEMDGVRTQVDAPAGEITREPVTLATVVAIVGIVKSAFEIAQKIKELLDRKKAENPAFNAVIQLPDGTRLTLENATVKDIERALKALPPRGE